MVCSSYAQRSTTLFSSSQFISGRVGCEALLNCCDLTLVGSFRGGRDVNDEYSFSSGFLAEFEVAHTTPHLGVQCGTTRKLIKQRPTFHAKEIPIAYLRCSKLLSSFERNPLPPPWRSSPRVLDSMWLASLSVLFQGYLALTFTRSSPRCGVKRDTLRGKSSMIFTL